MCTSRFGPAASPADASAIQKLGLTVGAVPDGHADVHLPAETQHPQRLVVEVLRLRPVAAVDSEVIDHAAIVCSRYGI